MALLTTVILKTGGSSREIQAFHQVRRCLSRSSCRHKALKNWSRPSISEIGVPSEPWQHVHNKNQKKFNLQLLGKINFLYLKSFNFHCLSWCWCCSGFTWCLLLHSPHEQRSKGSEEGELFHNHSIQGGAQQLGIWKFTGEILKIISEEVKLNWCKSNSKE